MMRRFHYLLAGFSVEDLEKLNINSFDVIDALGNKTDWRKEQVLMRLPATSYFSCAGDALTCDDRNT